MLINVKNVRQIFINLKATFQNAFDQAPSDWQKIAMVVPSTGKRKRLQLAKPFPENA